MFLYLTRSYDGWTLKIGLSDSGCFVFKVSLSLIRIGFVGKCLYIIDIIDIGQHKTHRYFAKMKEGCTAKSPVKYYNQIVL